VTTWESADRCEFAREGIHLSSEIWLEAGEVKLERKIAKLKKIVGTSMMEFDAADNNWPGDN
jgi:hypothetical protein